MQESVRPVALVFRVSKTLVIAEKPSVARDIAAALPGAFAKHEGFLESDEWVITYAVGHLFGAERQIVRAGFNMHIGAGATVTKPRLERFG